MLLLMAIATLARFLLGQLGGAPSGDAGGSDGGGTSGPPAAPPTSGSGDAGSGSSGPASGSSSPPAGFVPYERFESVNRRARELEEADRARQEEDAKKRGDHEKVIASKDEKITSLAGRFRSLAIRVGFLEALGTKATDPALAYAAATAGDYLEGIEPDDEGRVDRAKLDAAIKKLLEDHKLLDAGKAGSTGRSFGGGDRSGAGNGGGDGQQPEDRRDVNRLSPQDKIRRGLEDLVSGGRRQG